MDKTLLRHLYGTAGFRDKATIIKDIIAPRIPSMLLYICIKNSWRRVGVMITASHNPVDDNGIKFVADNGELLPEYLEDKLTEIVNLDSDDYIKWLETVDKKYDFTIVVGYDPRPSSKDIFRVIKKGCNDLTCNFINVGLVTTPELHIKTVDPYFDYGKVFTELLNNYVFVNYAKQSKDNGSYYGTKAKLNVTVDCANGSGSKVMKVINENINDIQFNLINMDDPDKINENCGAEYVHKTHNLPLNLNNENGVIYDSSGDMGLYEGSDSDSDIESYFYIKSQICTDINLYACFDGDADRLIFINFIKDNVDIVDGDKIGVFMMTFIKKYVGLLDTDDPINIGFIQTAYANGASTDYVKDVLGVQTQYVATGVKYLHHEAKKYDIGFYFESNGHGTVLFKPSFIGRLRKIKRVGNKIQKNAARKILNFYQLINQLIGDAISCLLVICYIFLTEKNVSWNNLYRNKPCKQYKIYIKNKNMIRVSEDETKVIEPDGLQQEIDCILELHKVRGFIRPSGTEDCVRLYVEGDNISDEDFDTIFNKIDTIVKKYVD